MRKISKRRSTAGNCLVKLPKCSGRGHYEASKGAGSPGRDLPYVRDEDEEGEMKGVAKTSDGMTGFKTNLRVVSECLSVYAGHPARLRLRGLDEIILGV